MGRAAMMLGGVKATYEGERNAAGQPEGRGTLRAADGPLCRKACSGSVRVYDAGAA